MTRLTRPHAGARVLRRQLAAQVTWANEPSTVIRVSNEAPSTLRIERELVRAAQRYVRARRRTWLLVPAPVAASVAIASPLWIAPDTVSFALTAVWFCSIVVVAGFGFGSYAFVVGGQRTALDAFYGVIRLHPDYLDLPSSPDELLASSLPSQTALFDEFSDARSS